jgi:hypothetical protein
MDWIWNRNGDKYFILLFLFTRWNLKDIMGVAYTWACHAHFFRYYCHTDYWFKTIFHPYFFRAQNLYCWSGQCRKNDDIVSVPYERSCTHITHHWFKCRRGGMEKRTLYHVGPGRSRISTRRLEHLLLKHRSELYTYIKVRWLQGRTWHIKITTITNKNKKVC